jgi:hypothetical protein
MTTLINASNTSGLTFTSDTSGNVAIQSNGANVIATVGSNVTVTGALTATGGFIQGASAAPAFSATPTTSQSVTSVTWTKVNLGTENFDTNNNFASSRFTPTVAGYYQLNATLYMTVTSGTYVWVALYKNGSAAIYGNLNPPVGVNDGGSVVAGLLYMNGSTDYVEIYCYSVGTSPAVGTVYTNFSGFLARSA